MSKVDKLKVGDKVKHNHCHIEDCIYLNKEFVISGIRHINNRVVIKIVSTKPKELSFLENELCVVTD
jgi:hypothetical protein